jgi:DNA-binding response OmpR family regulator
MTRRDPVQILIVDDEPDVRKLLSDSFELEGYGVAQAANGAQMRAHMESNPVSLITLDLNLGGEDGLALAREIRAKNNVPIIMISGKNDLTDRVVGLELGADDYISKPFRLREVLARVRAVLRRYREDSAPVRAEEPGEPVYAFGELTLHPRRREVARASGEIVDLTAAEFNLLELLVTRPARVLTRDNIMDFLKGHDWSPLDRSIDTLVARLRKKIEREPDQPRLIKTVRSVGYVFAAEVQKR